MARRRMWLAALVLVLSVAGPVGVWAGTPGGDPDNGTWVGGLQLQPGPEQLVLWNLPGSGGVRGTCVDANVNGPLRGPYSLAQTVADPVYGELNHLYADAATSDVRLAELSALNSHKYDIVDRNQQWSYLVNGQGGTSVADAAQMLDRATALAGPYHVRIELPNDVRAGPTYTATVSVTAARGAPVPGARVTLHADNASLTATQVTTSANGQAHVSFAIAPGSASQYTLRASVQSWTNVAFYAAPGEQRMLSAAAPTTQSGQNTGPIVRDRTTALVKAALDDSGHLPVAGYSYRITDANGAVVVASVTTGTTPVSLGRLTMGARYTATEIGRPPGGALYIPTQSSFEFTVEAGSGTWTVLAQDPRIPVPQLATQVNAERVQIGAALSDVVTLAGDDGEDGVIQAVRYGPVPPPRSGRCGDVTLAQYRSAPALRVQTPVAGSVNHGNGTYTITGPVVRNAGCYGWAETVTLQPSGVTATSPPTAPHEATLVVAPTVAPQSTAVVPALAQTGAAFPVRRTVLVGLGLLLAGVLCLWAARRSTSTRSSSC